MLTERQKCYQITLKVIISRGSLPERDSQKCRLSAGNGKKAKTFLDIVKQLEQAHAGCVFYCLPNKAGRHPKCVLGV